MPKTYASYYKAVGRTFNARLQPFRELLSTEGRVRHEIGVRAELLLVRFLNDYLPRRWAAGTGLIVGLEETGEPLALEVQSDQIDVFIYDAFDYPVLFRDGEFVVVMPEAVAAHIHVRTTLTSSLLEGAVRQVQKVKRLPRIDERVHGYVVGFTMTTPGQLLPKLQELDATIPGDESMYGLCVLDHDYAIGPRPGRLVYESNGCEFFIMDLLETLMDVYRERNQGTELETSATNWE
jgi:hypothetical protein